mmetsp:Transcript_1572/g.6474  ORF Transcript_1572/g.6474 Transcript_1572/m.6474 type:complete len:250 (+) Transcript_1572:113-862(+)
MKTKGQTLLPNVRSVNPLRRAAGAFVVRSSHARHTYTPPTRQSTPTPHLARLEMVLDMVWIWFPCDLSEPVPTPSACSTCSTSELPRMDLPTPLARFITLAMAPSSKPPLFHRRNVSSSTGTALARALRLNGAFVDLALDAFATVGFLPAATGSILSVLRMESRPKKPPNESLAVGVEDADPRLATEGLLTPPFLTFSAARAPPAEDAPCDPPLRLPSPAPLSSPEAVGEGVPGARSRAGGRSSAFVSK